MKLHQTIAVFFAASSLSLPAFAEEEKRGFYVAPEVGQIELVDICEGLPSCEDSEFGFGISGGYQFNEIAALEGGIRFSSGYGFSGELNSAGADLINSYLANSPANAGDNVKVDGDYRSFSLGGRGRFPIGDRFALTGKAGFHFWEAEVNVTVGSLSGSVDTDGTDPYFGAGVEFNASENVSIIAEYTRFIADAEISGVSLFDDADVISGAVVVRF